MRMLPSATVARLRQPEHTGENRCVPCAAVNLVISFVAAAATGAMVWPRFGRTAGLLIAGAILALATGTVYLRGYLIPGTPWLARSFLPDRVLSWFENHPNASPARPDEEIDVGAVLESAGVVEECDNQDDLCLTNEFESAWAQRIEVLRGLESGRHELAAVFDVDADRLLFQAYDETVGGPFVAYLDSRNNRIGQWESKAAYLADMAGAEALGERFAGWDDLNVRQQGTVLNSLRVFLRECPSCGGALSFGEDRVASCCRSIDVVVMTCDDCGSRLLEV